MSNSNDSNGQQHDWSCSLKNIALWVEVLIAPLDYPVDLLVVGAFFAILSVSLSLPLSPRTA